LLGDLEEMIMRPLGQLGSFDLADVCWRIADDNQSDHAKGNVR
jgi:hypothetical protein